VRRAALLGWLYGAAWIGAGTWWLFISMHRYGGLPAPLAALAVAALASALALYLALAMAAFARWRSGRAWVDAPLFAACWLLAELARGVLFTGFPWLASGYAQVDAPLALLAPWVGVYGVGAAGAALSLLLAVNWRARGVAVALMAALALAPPAEFSRPAAALTVTLLQTNVAQDEKFALDRMPEALEWVAQALGGARGELVVAPETAVPLLPWQLEELVPGYWPALQARFAVPGRAALVGVPLGDYESGYTNSVVALSAGAPYRYDKWHLVPFGEFIPRGFRWFTELMNIPLGDFARGVRRPPSFAHLGARIAPNICYEDLFGEELALRFADEASAPTVFANLSNIGWFGDTIAVAQHLNISRFRTLEFQRPMIRATNTGATVIIDHRGRVASMLPPFTRGVLDGTAHGRDGLTPFARWAERFGLALPAAVAAAVVALAAIAARRRAR
jgi:apolipoprotein N-acyltransferase